MGYGFWVMGQLWGQEIWENIKLLIRRPREVVKERSFGLSNSRSNFGNSLANDLAAPLTPANLPLLLIHWTSPFHPPIPNSSFPLLGRALSPPNSELPPAPPDSRPNAAAWRAGLSWPSTSHVQKYYKALQIKKKE